MTYYTIPEGTLIHRGKVDPDKPWKLDARWDTIQSKKQVTYTDDDLRADQVTKANEYYEFNLPIDAQPYDVLAVEQKLVKVQNNRERQK